MILLQAGAWEAGIEPAIGGALAFLRAGGIDVMRPAQAEVIGPLDMANFPLVPYANRIAHGRFMFGDQGYEIASNFGDHPHSLHGCGWLSVWTIVDQTGDSVTIRHDHRPDADWPFAYEAEQRFTLTGAGLRTELSLRNSGRVDMPGGLGFHPYFPVHEDSLLRFTAGPVWLSDETMIPDRLAPSDHFGDFAKGAPARVEGLIDNCWQEWDGNAALTSGQGSVRVRAEGAQFLHIFSPPGESFVCMEPTSQMPDAIHQSDRAMAGAQVLVPDEVMTISMTVSREP